MLKILILGGSGFVSKALAKHLIKQGYSIDILTNNEKSIDYIGFNNNLICDRDSLRDLESAINNKNYNVIFDIDGYTKKHIKNVISCININDLKRYIFCSSASVYLASKSQLTEDSPTGISSNNKSEAENYIFELISKKNLPATIFRPTYIYGEENNHYRECYFFDSISKDNIITVPDDNILVQFIHIQDLVKVFECAIFNDNDKRAYNLSNPDCISWVDFINMCGKLMKRKAKIKLVSTNDNEVHSFFPFRSINYNLSIKNLRENGFHTPIIRLEDGLNSTYSWYLKENSNNLI